MALSKAAQEFLKNNPKESPSPATPPKEYTTPNAIKSVEDARATLEAKKAELEIKRLEKELERLDKPDTSLDYYGKMLELQSAHNQTLLSMQKSNFDVQLELEKLKVSKNDVGDFGEEFLYSLIPLLPELIKHRGDKKEVPKETEGVKSMPKIPTAEQMEEIKTKIKSGELTEDQFIQDAITAFPNLKDNVQKIKEEYFKLKNG